MTKTARGKEMTVKDSGGAGEAVNIEIEIGLTVLWHNHQSHKQYTTVTPISQCADTQ